MTGNICIRAICEKTNLPVEKITAGADIVIALAAFSLAQVVHSKEFEESGQGDPSTSLSVVVSIFELISGLGGAYGSLAPDPLEKAIAAIVVAGSDAYISLLKTGKSAIAIEKEKYNYITEGV